MATAVVEETERVLELLGGRSVFGRRISSAAQMQDALRKGLPYGAFEALLAVLDVRAEDLAGVLGVASRTLARRKVARHLSPVESDRLYRVAYITLLASEVLGSLDKARTWLHESNQALGGERPIALLDTEVGAHQVEDVLNRISHGIFS